MQITFKYSPHSILLAGPPLNTMGRHPGLLAPHLGKIFCAESLLLAGSGDPWAQPVGLPLCCNCQSESIRGKECQALFQEKSESLLALEGTPALIKPNRLVLLIWKLRVRATNQRAPNQKVSYSGLRTRTRSQSGFPTSLPFLLFHLPTVLIAVVLPFLKVHFKWRLLSVDPMLGRYPSVDAFLSRLINSRLSSN